jgi:S-adenosylmethionine hydrolase
VLERALHYCPIAVHVAIVDPGVGTDRRPVALEAADGRIFVGPDNGVLTWALERAGGARRAVVLDDPTYWLDRRSRTFDGRDIFVPVAAHVSTGLDLGQVGSPLDREHLLRLDRLVVQPSDAGGIEAYVIDIDGFGNIETNIDAEDLASLATSEGSICRLTSLEGDRELRIVSTFADADRDELVGLIDSNGHLALCRNGARADQVIGLRPYDRFVLDNHTNG